jgi:serine/threonine protein kinase
MSHPQIIPVQQVGWWDAAPYLVLEYIPRGSLAAGLSGRPYPLRDALRLVRHLAEIVSYLHRQGIVHANLKPSNVLLAADGIPRLSDVHIVGSWIHSRSLAGVKNLDAWRHLPPELLNDPSAEPRPYTDIYGLGVILYALLTGRLPWETSGVKSSDDPTRLAALTPPSRYNSSVTPAVEACCLRCLDKNPWRRFPRAYDLMQKLRCLQDNPEGRL